MAKKRLSNADFVHLHNHTEYSVFDGVNKIKKFPAYAAEMGFKALAITDHGNMGGAFKFMNECRRVGIKPIVGCLLQGQEIFTLNGVKPVEQIQVGDMVLTHKGRFRKVLRTMTRRHSGELYTINLAHRVSRSLSLTEEHPILIRKHTGELDWLKPGDIEAGRKSKKQGIPEWLSYVCLPKMRDYSVETVRLMDYLPDNFSDDYGYIRKAKKSNKFESLLEWPDVSASLKVDRDFAYLLGLFCAEGSTDEKGRITFSFHCDEYEFIDFCLQWIKSNLSIEAKVNERREKNQTDVYFSNVPFCYFLRETCGVGSENKKIPSFILQSNKEAQQGFVRGLLDGDGKKPTDTAPQEVLRVTSQDLAWGLRMLMLDSDCWSTVSKYEVEDRKTIYQVPYNPLRKYARSLSDEDYVYKPIKSITKEHIEVQVFNFEVEEDNSYVSDFILHNCEFYLAKDRHVHFRSKKDSKGNILEEGQTDGRKGNRHLVLIAKNWKGYQNLCRLSQASWTEGYAFQDPRIDFELLEKHHEGLICSSACLSSVVNANLLHDRYDQARKAAGMFQDLFGEDFFLEVMYHGIDAEAMIIPDVLKLSDELGCKCIASNDCHYCEQCQGTSQELLMAMSTSKCLTDPKHIHFPFNEFYLKSAEQMQVHFGSQPKLLTNTVAIADSINSDEIMENLTGKMRLPRYPIPEDFSSPHHYLEHLAYEGLKALGWDKSPEHVDRLKLELRDVGVAWENNRYDFATYFLVVRDYIIAAKERNILVGCGRGSGFGSVLLRCLNISYGPDPLQYGLLWERFLGFDEKFFISTRDFGIEDDADTVKNAALEAKNDDLNEDRNVEDDMGGVDRY